ncbi:EAL domain-containing protein [Vibrio makurazakiensis]|uniref:EAL domain-containing protein n=1 Tax=Vibrio makurazakiensis TaxID=2910250 RepID=UPI003D13061A
MVLTDRKEFLKCISVDTDLQYIAKYKGLTLKSVYQPIFDHDMSQVGVEALVRISDSDGSNIRPDHFFHSEQTNACDKINVERLSRVIHIRNFSQSNIRELQLFLNVLPNVGELFATENISDSLLAKRLQELSLSNDQIIMELVELDAECDYQLKRAAQALSDSGFQIAVDDFGTNASTEERVMHITPNILKVDRSLMLEFEKGKSEQINVALQLAKRIGAKTVIEGIETQEQFDMMKELGFNMYQGYHLAMPMPIQLNTQQAV